MTDMLTAMYQRARARTRNQQLRAAWNHALLEGHYRPEDGL